MIWQFIFSLLKNRLLVTMDVSRVSAAHVAPAYDAWLPLAPASACLPMALYDAPYGWSRGSGLFLFSMVEVLLPA